MDQHLFILLVFTGVFPFVLSVTHRYFLDLNGKTWSDAQAYCQATYIDLAIIESNDDVVQIQNEAQRQQFSSSAWIGLYNDVKSWHWSSGNEPLGKMTNWVSGQPNNKAGNQTCGSIVAKGWDDQNCATTHPFICFDEINHKYVYINTTMTWYEAQSYCRQQYTDLAIARNETEISIVQGLYSRWSTYTWIGLFRDYWKWIDLKNFSTITWMPGKPNNALGNENCGYLTNIQVEDDQCSSVKPFFCYLETKKQQVIRIKVQSTQDVNELNAAIFGQVGSSSTILFIKFCHKHSVLQCQNLTVVFLQVSHEVSHEVRVSSLNYLIIKVVLQIEQKLKDNGMTEEVTVKWRVRKDGMVFHKKERREKIIVGLFNCV